MLTRAFSVVLALGLTTAGCSSEDHAAHDGAGREVAIRTSDQLRFEPSRVDAKPGEVVTFVVTNPGSVAHEFAIGNAAFHEAHGPTVASATAAPTGMASEHAGHAAIGGTHAGVPSGQTVRVTFTMPADEAPTYACHLASHDKAGMTGQVSYTQ